MKFKTTRILFLGEVFVTVAVVVLKVPFITHQNAHAQSRVNHSNGNICHMYEFVSLVTEWHAPCR